MKIILAALICVLAVGPAFAIDQCGSGKRHTCVVDGDTLWIDGVKLRAHGYDTPETTTSICGGASEVALGQAATRRFIEILNTSRIEISPVGRKGRYCRYPLSCRDVRDLLAERGVKVDASTIHRWVRKFGPEIRKRAYGGHRSWRGQQWHVDETYTPA